MAHVLLTIGSSVYYQPFDRPNQTQSDLEPTPRGSFYSNGNGTVAPQIGADDTGILGNVALASEWCYRIIEMYMYIQSTTEVNGFDLGGQVSVINGVPSIPFGAGPQNIFLEMVASGSYLNSNSDKVNVYRLSAPENRIFKGQDGLDFSLQVQVGNDAAAIQPQMTTQINFAGLYYDQEQFYKVGPNTQIPVIS